MRRAINLATLSAAALLVGCNTMPQEAGFGDVQTAVAERTGQRVQWNRLTSTDAQVASAVHALVASGIDEGRAVQIALLNNRRLQATYEDLGVAQADVVQAGLLRNPVFSGDAKFATGGGGTNIELSVVTDFLDLFMIPLRKRVAEDAFEAAKLRVSAAAIDLAGRTRSAFIEHVAAEQVLELRQTVTAAATASFDFANRRRAAGNLSELDLATERALYEQSKLDLARAESATLDTRERLTVLMGLWGADTAWTSGKRLPDVPPDDVAADPIERQAVERSLDLAMVRRQITASARVLGIRNTFGLVPEVELGAAAERETDGSWGVGPAVSLPVPLFDQGQAASASARSALERARQDFVATAVETRSAARVARNKLMTARATADYYRHVIVPLRHQITGQTLLHYNGMYVGANTLLRAKQDEIEAGVAAVTALRDYWLARTQFDLVLSGRTTDVASSPTADIAMSSSNWPTQAGH